MLPTESANHSSEDSDENISSTKEFLSIIHLGGIERTEVMKMLILISSSAMISDAIIVSGSDGRFSLRVEMVTQHSQLKDIRLELARVHPHVRFKLMSTGNSSLSRKLYLKISRVHSKPILTGYFSTFGDVRKIELKFNSSTNRSRNFCYITFSLPESAQKAIAFGTHNIAGKPVSCFACKPFDIRSHESTATVIELAKELEMLKSLRNKQYTSTERCQKPLAPSLESEPQNTKVLPADMLGLDFEQLDDEVPGPGNLAQLLDVKLQKTKCRNSQDDLLTRVLSNTCHQTRSRDEKPVTEFQSAQVLQLVDSNHLRQGNLVFNVLQRFQRR
jgi:RNA recognition motif. (a.k.a. RRM, RBD, or RNP domain)